jgi:hypothetical protein
MPGPFDKGWVQCKRWRRQAPCSMRQAHLSGQGSCKDHKYGGLGLEGRSGRCGAGRVEALLLTRPWSTEGPPACAIVIEVQYQQRRGQGKPGSAAWLGGVKRVRRSGQCKARHNSQERGNATG